MIDQAQGTWLDAMNAVSAVCTVIQTMIALTEEQVAAKMASRVEDIKHITLLAVDYVKAFGAMIAQLAVSTAEWVKNTAAKAASTAAVMDDQISAMMAGFEATVAVQRDILEAVLGIQIGNDVIGKAADRYHRKLSIMRGI